VPTPTEPTVPLPDRSTVATTGPPPASPDGRHRYQTRVQWVDTDASGRIHFSAAFRWAEAAEHDLLQRDGHAFAGDFPRVDVGATYLERLGFGDQVEVVLGTERVGRSSITYRWEVRRDGVVCVRGRHVVVYVPDGSRAAELPAPLRATLAAVAWDAAGTADGRSEGAAAGDR
jgi:acyl-CoA thioester hydrolase